MQEEARKQDGRLLDRNRYGHRKGFKLSWDLLTQFTQQQESRKGRGFKKFQYNSISFDSSCGLHLITHTIMVGGAGEADNTDHPCRLKRSDNWTDCNFFDNIVLGLTHETSTQ
jgi:hypothetical protein